MNCRDAQTMLHAYTDGELDLSASLEIERHLQQCADCAQFHKNIVALHAALQARDLYHAAPAKLVGHIRAAAQRAARPNNRSIGLYAGLAMAGSVVGVVLVILLMTSRPTGTDGAALAREVVSCHVRSLMASHLTDVASTDRHTVKPWFNGKLDFAPPVIDLRAAGFPLTGGRLDYLDERPVAVLVYARQKHTINLFVWPVKTAGPVRSEPLETLTQKGYHIARWVQSDLQFWAVSDLNATELAEFAHRIRDAAGRNL